MDLIEIVLRMTLWQYHVISNYGKSMRYNHKHFASRWFVIKFYKHKKNSHDVNLNYDNACVSFSDLITKFI